MQDARACGLQYLPEYFLLNNKSHLRDLNPKPATYDAAALPIELRWHSIAGDNIA